LEIETSATRHWRVDPPGRGRGLESRWWPQGHGDRVASSPPVLDVWAVRDGLPFEAAWARVRWGSRPQSSATMRG